MKPRNKKDCTINGKSTKLQLEKNTNELVIVKPDIFNYMGKDIWLKLIK